MESKQIDRMIESIREDDSKTNALSSAILEFNHSFNQLIENLADTMNIEKLQQNQSQMLQLDLGMKQLVEHLEQNKKQQTEQFQQLREQIGGLRCTEHAISDTAIMYDGRILIIGGDRISVFEYNIESHTYNRAYFGGCERIKSIFTYQNKVFLHRQDGRIYTLQDEELGVSKVKEIKLSKYGIVLLGENNQLRFYNGTQAVSFIGQDVGYFEIVEERYLIYQVVIEGDEETYYAGFIGDLKDNKVDDNLMQKLFDYSVTQ